MHVPIGEKGAEYVPPQGRVASTLSQISLRGLISVRALLVAVAALTYTIGHNVGQAGNQQLRDGIDQLKSDTTRLKDQAAALQSDNDKLRGIVAQAPQIQAQTPQPDRGLTTPSPRVDITSPDGAQPVPMEISVGGTSQGLAEGQDIWIVLAPAGTDFLYPQSGPASRETDGDWLSRNVRLGGAARTFDILAVVADSRASNEFRTYLGTSTSGIGSLPIGAVQLDHVTVSRMP